MVFALEGDHKAVEAARRLVSALHGSEFVIAKENKVLYHAFGSFLAPLLLTTLVTAEKWEAGRRATQVDPCSHAAHR